MSISCHIVSFNAATVAIICWPAADVKLRQRGIRVGPAGAGRKGGGMIAFALIQSSNSPGKITGP
jgi:hypothetical protein